MIVQSIAKYSVFILALASSLSVAQSSLSSVASTKHNAFNMHSKMILAGMSGTIYKTVHADGSITYSDKPSPGAVKVELSVPMTTIKSNAPTPSIQAKTKTKDAKQYTVKIMQPAPEETIRNNLGELTIAASIEPRIGGVFQLSINGQVHESATGMFRLTDMDRGAYDYNVKFIDNSGKVIASSESRKLYLHQASALIN